MIDPTKLDTATLIIELDTMYGASPAYMMRMAKEAADRLRSKEAEIERLRAALAGVTAERDAAVGVLREAHNVLIEPYPTFADEDDETAQKLDEHQRVTELLESALTAAPHPATPPAAGAEATAETGEPFTDAEFAQIMRNLDESTIKDAIHQAHYTIEFMQEQAAEGNYEAAFEHLAVVLVNHNIALKTLAKEGRKS